MEVVEHFWKYMWCNEKPYNKNVDWIRQREGFNKYLQEQALEDITIAVLRITLMKVYERKSISKDKWPSFWLASLKCTDEKLVQLVNKIMINHTKIHDQLVTGIYSPKKKKYEIKLSPKLSVHNMFMHLV